MNAEKLIEQLECMQSPEKERHIRFISIEKDEEDKCHIHMTLYREEEIDAMDTDKQMEALQKRMEVARIEGEKLDEEIRHGQ